MLSRSLRLKPVRPTRFYRKLRVEEPLEKRAEIGSLLFFSGPWLIPLATTQPDVSNSSVIADALDANTAGSDRIASIDKLTTDEHQEPSLSAILSVQSTSEERTHEVPLKMLAVVLAEYDDLVYDRVSLIDAITGDLCGGVCFEGWPGDRLSTVTDTSLNLSVSPDETAYVMKPPRISGSVPAITTPLDSNSNSVEGVTATMPDRSYARALPAVSGNTEDPTKGPGSPMPASSRRAVWTRGGGEKGPISASSPPAGGGEDPADGQYIVIVTLNGGMETAAEAEAGPVAAGSCHPIWVEDVTTIWTGHGPPPPTAVVAIEWTVPSLPVIFESFTHVQDDRDEVTNPAPGDPHTKGEVKAYVPPPPTPPITTIGFCLGPVEQVFPVTATVTLSTGESGSDTNYMKAKEQHVVGQGINVPRPEFITTGLGDVAIAPVAPGQVPVLFAQGDPTKEPDGYFGFIQLVTITGTFTLDNNDVWTRNTNGQRVDGGAPVTDNAFVPQPHFHNNVPVLEEICSINDPQCARMEDAAFVAIDKFHMDRARFVVTGAYTFQAQVWLMFSPQGEPSAANWVPVARATWSWNFSVARVAGFNPPYVWLSRNSGFTPFAEIDQWPTWTYDSADSKGWWTKNP